MTFPLRQPQVQIGQRARVRPRVTSYLAPKRVILPPIVESDNEVRNYLANPSAETNLSNITAVASATLTRITSQSQYGVASVQVDTSAAGAAGQGAQFQMIDNAFAQNDVVSLSVWAKGAAGGEQIRLQLTQRDSAGAAIGTVTFSPTVQLTTGWQRITWDGLTLDQAAVARAYLRATQLTPSNATFYLDAAMVVRAASTPTNYGDGSFAGWSWAGTAHNSASFSNTGALALTRQKSITPGAVSSAASALAVQPTKSLAVPTVTETSAAQTITEGGAQAQPVTGATEADAAQGIARQKSKAVATVTTASAAQGITRSKARALTGGTETDTALAPGRTSQRTVAQGTEADAAQAVARSKRRALTPAGETDAPQAITSPGEQAQPVTPASESDVPQGIGRSKRRALTTVTAANTAQTITASSRRGLTTVTAASAAQGIARSKRRALAPAGESDASVFSETGVQIVQVQPVMLPWHCPASGIAETDTVPAVVPASRRLVGAVGETDTAVGAARGYVRASETDTVPALGRVSRRAITPVGETDTAAPVFEMRLVVGVGETDASPTLARSKRRALATVNDQKKCQSLLYWDQGDWDEYVWG